MSSGREQTTYPELFRIPAFPRLAGGVILARTASQMMQLTLVLFVLLRFHSPTLAGITVFLAIAPGIATSPLAGALLDRHGRVRLITLDYLVGAASLLAIAGLDLFGRLTPVALLPIVAVSSLTYSLSNSGARSLLPLIVPKPLWDRANALDSIAYAVTIGLGPALAGGLSASSGPRAALLCTALLFVLAAVLMAGLREPVARSTAGGVLAEAWAGLTHVLVRNPSLRGIALVVSLMNIGLGVLVVAVPVMVFQRLHGSPVFVGELWAIYGLSSVPSALVFGRVNTEGRERIVMTLCAMTAGLGVAFLAVAGSPLVAAGAMLIAGLANGPFDVSMFSLRQRRTISPSSSSLTIVLLFVIGPHECHRRTSVLVLLQCLEHCGGETLSPVRIFGNANRAIEIAVGWRRETAQHGLNDCHMRLRRK